MLTIDLNDLLVTHNQLRNINTVFYYLHEFKKFRYDLRNKLIITNFGDSVFLRDGHHKSVALYHYLSKMGDTNLPITDFEEENYSYQEYDEINFKEKWITPFNPITHVRKHDLNKFKDYVWWLYWNRGEDVAKEFILGHKHYYLEDRKVNTVRDLYNKYRTRIMEVTGEKEDSLGIPSHR